MERAIKKNILFLTAVRITDPEEKGIYTDLLRKFRDEGHSVYVVCPEERRFGGKTRLNTLSNINVLYVKSLNLQKTSLLEKGLSTVLLSWQLFKTIKKYFETIKFDLVLYSTPPITYNKAINYLKRKDNCLTYLLLKDIFPQNAIDLQMMKKDGVIHKYFKKVEKKLYNLSDFIGCMSQANLNYVIKNNPELEKTKLEVNPNSIEVKESALKFEIDIYSKYNIPRGKIIFIFGGNLGVPQGIEFLKKNIAYCKSVSEAFFLIVGDGTEYQDFNNWIQIECIKNALLIKELPKSEYDEIINLSHVGLIFLNPHFSIPNFPSRILSYMQNRLPVICATDLVTDIGKIAVENNFGYKCLTTDFEAFFDYVIKLLNKELREQMGNNSYNFLINEYNTDISYNKIIKKINTK